MSKVKITDIAERSGVSMTTVSRYFNHPGAHIADNTG
ncbi:MAG: LacI family DNA-binding transcriptional regulator [Ruminococcus sp.]